MRELLVSSGARCGLLLLLSVSLSACDEDSPQTPANRSPVSRDGGADALSSPRDLLIPVVDASIPRDTGLDLCAPFNCASANAQCGMVVDSCSGESIWCGTCPPPSDCGAGGVANRCGCVPTQTCASQGYRCGSFTDDCGNTQDCGGCGPNEVCGGRGRAHTCERTARLGESCDPANDICEQGLRCCTECCSPRNRPVCTPVDSRGGCALPDLSVNESVLRSSVTFESVAFDPNACTVVEGCIDTPGVRELLRFSTDTPNTGTADVILGDPVGNSTFRFSQCHWHYHFEEYAEYRLLDSSGQIVMRGRKQAFCLLDSRPLPGTTGTPSYSCTFQGLSVGWSDFYGFWLECQWIDVTGLPPGNYVLEVEVNPARILPEIRYDNNVARANVRIGP